MYLHLLLSRRANDAFTSAQARRSPSPAGAGDGWCLFTPFRCNAAGRSPARLQRVAATTSRGRRPASELAVAATTLSRTQTNRFQRMARSSPGVTEREMCRRCAGARAPRARHSRPPQSTVGIFLEGGVERVVILVSTAQCRRTIKCDCAAMSHLGLRLDMMIRSSRSMTTPCQTHSTRRKVLPEIFVGEPGWVLAWQRGFSVHTVLGRVAQVELTDGRRRRLG